MSARFIERKSNALRVPAGSVAGWGIVWYKRRAGRGPFQEGGCAIVPIPQGLPVGVASGWVIAAIVAGIIELLSPTFGFVFVGAGALAAAGLAALGLPFFVQLACFAAVVLLSLVFLRPHFAKKLAAQGVPTRIEALVGKIGQVTVAIEPASGSGRVEVAGQDWAAHSSRPLSPGTQIVVDGADGIVLHVKEVEAPNHPV